MGDFIVRDLSAETWPAFADIVERHNGVWGGCWCMAFHPEGVGKGHTPAGNREAKHERVLAGTTHSALVMDGDTCVGWCQFGSPTELPRVKSRRKYEAGLEDPPDWRITCFFVDRRRRGEGIASAALAGALASIATAGGGVVEGYPEETEGFAVQGSHLHTGTVGMFLDVGFVRQRQISPRRWVMARSVAPA
ncbi:MAG: GNAT family N-acetyltransferase [Actinomycetales bacterium]|nr:GNAT family N-acetyltransferase [Actinomycetales bacterium]